MPINQGLETHVRAIHTKLMGPTDRKGTRIKATFNHTICMTVPYQYDLDVPRNHRYAALQLVEKMGKGSPDEWVSGCLNDGTYTHIRKV